MTPGHPLVEWADVLIVVWVATAAGMFIVIPVAIIVAAVLVSRAQKRAIGEDLLREAQYAREIAEWFRDERLQNGHEGRDSNGEWGPWTKRDEASWRDQDRPAVKMDGVVPDREGQGGVAP